MGRFFQIVVRFKIPILLVIISLTIIAGLELRNLEIDTSMDRLAPKNTPEKQLHLKAVAEFGGEKMAAIYIQDDQLYTSKKLQILQELIWRFEEIPELESIYSAFTTPFIYNDGETLHTSPLFEEVPEKDSLVLEKINRIGPNNSYRRFILNPEKNSMLITIQFDPSQRTLQDVAKQIDEQLAPVLSSFDKIYQVGTPALMNFTHQNMVKSFVVILPAIVFVISSLIFIGTKSINAAILPFLIASISLIWTFAVMSIFNIPLQILTSCVPGMAFILGSTEITHLLSKYRQFLNQGFSHKKALTLMGEKIGLAIVLTALTTTFGFLTIMINEITMLKEFGLMSAIALTANFILMIFYLPIHLDLFQESKKEISHHDFLESIKRKFLHIFDYLITNKYLYLMLFLILAGSIYYSQKIYIENISWSQVKESSDLKQKLYKVNDTFPGTNVMYFVIEAKEGNFKNYKNLQYLKKLQSEIIKFNEVHHTQSLADNIEIIHKEFNKDSILLSSIPEDDALVAQYLLSFSRENLAPFVSADYKRALIQLRHTNYTTPAYNKLVTSLEKFIKEQIDKKSYYAYYTSSDKILNKATNSLIRSQISSLLIIVVIIIITIALLFGDLKIALIAVPSNLIPIIIFFGIMGLFNIPLTTGSAMVAAITVGIAIDDTIHFFVQYGHNLNKNSNPVEAAKLTIKDSSNAIITTSIALSTGFILMALSDFIPLYHFGLLSSLVILLAMICDLLITPTLITVFKLSNVVSYDNLFLTQLPIKELMENPLLKGINLKSLKQLVRQAGFSHINSNQKIEISKEQQYLIIISGNIIEMTKAQRTSDTNELIPTGDFKSGDIIEINPEANTEYHGKEATRYLLINRKSIEVFLKTKYQLD